MSTDKNSIDPRLKWKWKLPPVKLVNNYNFYCNVSKGKTVLHIGCTDHKDLIDIKMKQQTYLHTKLLQDAKVIHGVDTNKEALSYLERKYKISNLYCYNITEKERPVGLLGFYDVVLIPEVVEHVLDLGLFLKSVKQFMSPKSIMVIGTPNIFRIHNLLTIFKGIEEINPDHKYWFSFSTLKSLLEETGYEIQAWHIYIQGNPDRKFLKYGIRSFEKVIKSTLIELNPWLGDGIIVEAKLRKYD